MARSQPGDSGRKKASPVARPAGTRSRPSAGGPAATAPAASPADKPLVKKAGAAAKSTAKPTAKSTAKATARPPAEVVARPASKPATKRATAKSATPAPAAAETAQAPPPSGPGPIERYRLALAAYTDCLQLLQERAWVKAAAAFTAFIGQHGRERELADRARMYLSVCQQHIGSDGNAPRTFDERYAAAVILANRGEFDAALRLLDAALVERPESDKALYLKASTLAQQGQRRAALDLLTRAIARDEHNRVYAVNDPDFGSLRDDEEFITLTTREDEREL